MTSLRLALTIGSIVLLTVTMIQLLSSQASRMTWVLEEESHRDVLDVNPSEAQQAIADSTGFVGAKGIVRDRPLSYALPAIRSHEREGRWDISVGEKSKSKPHMMMPLKLGRSGQGTEPSTMIVDTAQSLSMNRSGPNMDQGGKSPITRAEISASLTSKAPRTGGAERTTSSDSSVVYAKPGEYFPKGLIYCNQPVNPHPYRFTINPQNLCKNETGGGVDVFLLVLIISAPGDSALRRQIRETYMQVTEVSGRKIKHSFLLGRSNDGKTNSDVLLESRRYQDIVREDFTDSYRNLTLKTLMGLKWASTYCPQATWVMKVDDDVLVSFNKAVPYLLGIRPAKNVIVGKVFRHAAPIRNKGSKWFVSSEEYAHGHYPDYASGGGYVISGDLIPRLWSESLNVPLFHIEDVFVGILADRLGVRLRHSTRFYSNYHSYSDGMIREAITAHMPYISPRRYREVWGMMRS